MAKSKQAFLLVLAGVAIPIAWLVLTFLLEVSRPREGVHQAAPEPREPDVVLVPVEVGIPADSRVPVIAENERIVLVRRKLTGDPVARARILTIGGQQIAECDDDGSAVVDSSVGELLVVHPQHAPTVALFPDGEAWGTHIIELDEGARLGGVVIDQDDARVGETHVTVTCGPVLASHGAESRDFVMALEREDGRYQLLYRRSVTTDESCAWSIGGMAPGPHSVTPYRFGYVAAEDCGYRTVADCAQVVVGNRLHVELRLRRLYVASYEWGFDQRYDPGYMRACMSLGVRPATGLEGCSPQQRSLRSRALVEWRSRHGGRRKVIAYQAKVGSGLDEKIRVKARFAVLGAERTEAQSASLTFVALDSWEEDDLVRIKAGPVPEPCKVVARGLPDSIAYCAFWSGVGAGPLGTQFQQADPLDDEDGAAVFWVPAGRIDLAPIRRSFAAAEWSRSIDVRPGLNEVAFDAADVLPWLQFRISIVEAAEELTDASLVVTSNGGSGESVTYGLSVNDTEWLLPCDYGEFRCRLIDSQSRVVADRSVSVRRSQPHPKVLMSQI